MTTLTTNLRKLILNKRESLCNIEHVLNSLPEDLPGTLTLSNGGGLWLDVSNEADWKTWKNTLRARMWRVKGDPYVNNQGVIRYSYHLATEDWPDSTLDREGQDYFPYLYDNMRGSFHYEELLINITPKDTCTKVKVGEKVIDLFEYQCNDDKETK